MFSNLSKVREVSAKLSKKLTEFAGQFYIAKCILQTLKFDTSCSFNFQPIIEDSKQTLVAPLHHSIEELSFCGLKVCQNNDYVILNLICWNAS